ncbi:MAG: EAL domain-containing protein [Gallionella sp.]
MKNLFNRIFHVVGPFAAAIALIGISVSLVAVIVLTELNTQWVTFLAGVLVAAILAEATRVSHAEWSLLRRTAQLKQAKDRLDEELRLRKKAEQRVTESKLRLNLLDEVLPLMVAYVDVEGICRYHNHAFMDWLRKAPTQINERSMREVIGAKIYQEIATETRQALDGHYVRYEQNHTRSDGALYRLAVEHIPQFSDDGKVSGFFMVMNDITSLADVQSDKPTSGTTTLSSTREATTSSQALFVDTFSEQLNGDKDAKLIMGAIERGEFRLYCQLISPLVVGSAVHYEILVRLAEEEESLMPPGAFFPLAEKYGLMPHLDRWVVQHVIAWAARHQHNAVDEKPSIYFINVSRATMGDPSFVDYFESTLQQYGVNPATLCFEIPGLELALRSAIVADFACRIRDCGCRVAISGFGRDRILFDLLRGFQVDFLKIDGSIIFDILRDPVDLAKLTAIHSVAKKLGITTIAELVENEATIVKLREIGIDFAQGFGISRPSPLAE